MHGASPRKWGSVVSDQITKQLGELLANWHVNSTTDGVHSAAFHIRLCQDLPSSWPTFPDARCCPLLACSRNLFTGPRLTMPYSAWMCIYPGAYANGFISLMCQGATSLTLCVQRECELCYFDKRRADFLSSCWNVGKELKFSPIWPSQPNLNCPIKSLSFCLDNSRTGWRLGLGEKHVATGSRGADKVELWLKWQECLLPKPCLMLPGKCWVEQV